MSGAKCTFALVGSNGGALRGAYARYGYGIARTLASSVPLLSARPLAASLILRYSVPVRPGDTAPPPARVWLGERRRGRVAFQIAQRGEQLAQRLPVVITNRHAGRLANPGFGFLANRIAPGRSQRVCLSGFQP